MNLNVSEIGVYPVKALGALYLQDSVVEKRGLRHDRRYLLVDERGMFLTQREHPKLASTDIRFKGDRFVVSGAMPEEIELPCNPAPEDQIRSLEVTVWGSRVVADVAAEEINRWFSDFLGFKVFTVHMPESTKRSINELFNHGSDIVSFADAYPVLVANTASLADLNSRLDSQITMNRFRPNIVVEGADAFAEDLWKRVRIGKTVFRVTKPCARCTVTTIDQTTGFVHRFEPLRTLSTFRTASQVYPDNFEALGLSKNDVLFGVTLVPENTGERVAVGDKFEVLETLG